MWGLFETVSGKATFDEWSKVATETQLINGKARNLNEVMQGPQVKHNKVIQTFEVPGIGKINLANPTAMFSTTPVGIRTMAPALGADCDDILKSLGYDADKIAALLQAGAVKNAKMCEERVQ